jgi:hypothetical protein
VVGIFTEKFHGHRFALYPGMKMTIKTRAFSRKKFHGHRFALYPGMKMTIKTRAFSRKSSMGNVLPSTRA